MPRPVPFAGATCVCAALVIVGVYGKAALLNLIPCYRVGVCRCRLYIVLYYMPYSVVFCIIYTYIYIYIIYIQTHTHTHTHTESRASFPRAPRTEATDLHAEPFSPRRHNGLGMRLMFWIVLGFRDHGLEFAMEQRISENALCIVI